MQFVRQLIVRLAGWSPVAERDGARSSGWTGYIKPILSRSNFDVLINHQVTKLIQTGKDKGVPAFRGVQFAQNSSGMCTIAFSEFAC